MSTRGGARPGAGKKKGSKASHTLLAAKTKEAFIVAVHENLQELFNSLLKEAKKGNMVALKEMLDRAWGKPTQPIAGDKENPLVFLPLELLDKYNLNEKSTPGTSDNRKG